MPKKNYYSVKESALNYIFSIATMLVLSFVIFYLVGEIVSATGKTYEDVVQFEWLNYLNSFLSGLSFFIVFFMFNLIKKKNFVKASRLQFKFNYKVFLLVLLVAIISVFACVNMTSFFNYLFSILTSKSVSTSLGVTINSFWEFCLILFIYALMPAVGEELVFRGIIYNGLREKFSAKTAILISSLLFALIHFSIFKTFYQFILGLILGIIVYFTGSIIYSMIFHFVNNFVVLLITCLSNGKSVFEFVSWGALEIILSIVIFIVGVLIMIAVFMLIRKICLKHKNYYKLEQTSEPLESTYVAIEQDNGMNKDKAISGKSLIYIDIALSVLIWFLMSFGGSV